MARIWDEQLEAVGYDETWSQGETVSAGCTLDEDANVTDVGSPAGWGSKCLKSIVTQSGDVSKVRHTNLAQDAIRYYRVEVVITDDQTSGTWSSGNVIINVSDNKDVRAFNIKISDTDGDLHFQLNMNDDGGGTNRYDGLFVPLENTLYRIEVKYDATNNAWAWRINDVDQPNNIDNTDPVESEGTLTDTHLTTTKKFEIGQSDNNKAGTVYFDNFAIDDTDWVGAESAGVEVEIGTVALTYTGKTIADYLAITETLGTVSVTFTGKALGILEGVIETITKVAVAFTGKALTILEGEIISIAKVAVTYTGKTLTVLFGTIETIAKVALTFTGKTLYWSITFIIPKVALTYTGKAFIVFFNEVVEIAKVALAYTGKTLYQNITYIISKTAVAFTGKALVINEVYVAVKGAVTFVGKAVQTAMPRIVGIVKGAFAFTGKPTSTKLDAVVTIGKGSITYTPKSLIVDFTELILTGGKMRFGMRPIMH